MNSTTATSTEEQTSASSMRAPQSGTIHTTGRTCSTRSTKTARHWSW